MALLLLADEQPSMIDRYIDRGEMFALVESEVRAVCVVTKERPGIYEVKNMATVPAYQRQGYGRRLLAMILEYYQKNTEAHTLLVGTGDSPATIGFYEACGFALLGQRGNDGIDFVLGAHVDAAGRAPMCARPRSSSSPWRSRINGTSGITPSSCWRHCSRW